jgi:hypothetical protein
MTIKKTYSETTNREFLSDMITNISPYDTPIHSMIGKQNVSATKVEWPEDTLRAPGANKHVEGASDVSALGTPTNRIRLSNYTQIFKEGYEVSETQQEVDKAGVSDELDYNMLKAMKTIAQDVEYMYMNSTAAVAGDNSTARESGGLQASITTNVLANGGTTRFITEALLNDGLQDAWAAGGDALDIICSGANKRKLSGFTAGNTKQVDAKDKKLIATVAVYESDFGLAKFHASRWMPDTLIYGLDKQYLKCGYLRNFKRKVLPDTNDSKSEIIKGELTLITRAEKAHFIIKDLKVV